ncbi:MAG: penicillin-binding transpeptidase domain-containing protein [Candidatus Pacebacteria bacterium]|jgi:penicillin-binding protein 2|nr:hypothetical protein [bacterium]MDP6527471.1 penicillin-binding transpeptidase domain-containing protein [Candidatus Paceibacterota bacterium]MDP6659678.1 penicillin-binding transpeptidase domain-containing protein [Candidatus Paceibacterota bacterium]|tara:strand:+ start:17040 stop:18737 length:1698 start_codon:yes stop_codon:yes gene_type:complete
MSRNRLRKFIKKLFSSVESHEIEPDEIFLDSSNLPSFDTSQFEGRLEHPISKNTILAFGIIVSLLMVLFAARLWNLQVVRGDDFSIKSEDNRLTHSILFAERGVIYDRNGVELAWNEEEEGEQFSRRIYTESLGVSHVLGYVGYPLKDSAGFYYRDYFVGKDGVEFSLNEMIKGENGLKIVEVDALNTPKSESTIRSQIDGESVDLSIDARLSESLYSLIKNRALESGFVGGAGVVMDVVTGEILALSSYPEYDPQVLSDGEDKETIASFVENSRKPFLNRVVSGLYTPGSIVKLFVAIGALTEGVITPEKRILSTGSIRVPHPYIPDTFSVFNDWKAHGLVDMRDALAVSSNVYFFEIGGGFEGQSGIGISGIEEYAKLFGLGAPTGIALSDEAIGVIPTPEWKAETFDGDDWRLGDTYNTSIGQYGFQVTPIQIVRMISAIANNGRLLVPTLIKDGGTRSEEINVSDINLQVIREGMRRGVLSGTATALNSNIVDVAAKTGTAEVGIRKKFVNSWVTGFFPYEDPRYAFAIIMERGPTGNPVGAASVMRGLLEWLSIYGVEYI